MTALHFLLASPALRRIEHDAASTLPPGTLMDRAAHSAAARVAASWPGGPVVVLCGPGNNGGDGFVLARLLHEAGRDVRVWALPAPPEGRPADAQRAWEALPAGLLQSGEPVWRAPRGEAVAGALGDEGDGGGDGGDGNLPDAKVDGHGDADPDMPGAAGFDADGATGAGIDADSDLDTPLDAELDGDADHEIDANVDTDVFDDAIDSTPSDADSADLVSTHALFGAPLLDQGRITTGLLLEGEAPGGVIIDALFGIGLTRPLDVQAQAWIAWANAQPVARLAIDVPSGLNADTGAAQDTCLQATRTLTFIADKPGLHTRAGSDVAGEVEVDTLALRYPSDAANADVDAAGASAGAANAEAASPDTAADTGRLIGRADCDALFRPRRHDSHKGSFGTLAVLAGAPGMTGAALLASRAALLTGAGKVFVALAERPPLGLPCDPLHPELMVRDAQSVIAAVKELGVTTWVAGCGLGTSDDAKAWLTQALQDQPDAAVVLDADALTLLGLHDALQTALAQRTGIRVLTPHPLEAARLLGRDTHAVQADRVAVARELAARFKAWVVLKGAGTVVSSPDGAWSINGSGNVGLATAGTGDVLSGMLGALLAQGLDPEDAIRGGVWLHGAAADHLVAQGCGPIGLSASEVATAARCVRNGG